MFNRNKLNSVAMATRKTKTKAISESWWLSLTNLFLVFLIMGAATIAVLLLGDLIL